MAAGRVLIALLVGALGVAEVVVGGPAATPAYAGTTVGAAGSNLCVAVVVDGRLTGGSVRTGCARRDPGTGLEALSAAGFSYTPRPRDGLICQIDGRPQCADTTTDRYWSYWYRAPGASRWVYASQGAGTHDPTPGSTEAWVWQDGGRREPPSTGFAQICPTRDREPSDPPLSAKSSGGPTGEPRDPPATGKPRSVSTRHASGTPKATATASAGHATATTPPSPPPSPAPTSPSSATSTAAVAAQNQRSDDGGGAPWLGLAIGAALIAALGGATWLRYRRTPGSPP